MAGAPAGFGEDLFAALTATRPQRGGEDVGVNADAPDGGAAFARGFDVRDGRGIRAGADSVLHVIDNLELDPAFAIQRIGERRDRSVPGADDGSLLASGSDHRLQLRAVRSRPGMVAGIRLDQLERGFGPQIRDLECAPDLVGGDLLARGVRDGLDHFHELDLQAPREVQVIVVLQDVRDAALS